MMGGGLRETHGRLPSSSRFRMIADGLANRILTASGVPSIPAPQPARAPPLPAGDPDVVWQADESLVVDPCS
ncbi:MAG: hypothetical protein A3G76_11545 [Acidobacteria bacterium RIFCSPLOWO2_12_FULL_65_11]|nr:MAG: hypothetical protein A3G76_11545 [Acidobacteria bacterium RIFCSPLOWO2_12_FULL_65_11]